MCLSEIAALLGAHCGGEPGTEITGVSTDSRTVQPGELFVALAGERFDGHAYIADAFSRGAAAALAERETPEEETGRVLRVPSTERALGALAAAYRGMLPLTVIGVTGSVGKTTTKELIAALLAQRLRVQKTQGNLNNHLGLPQTILQFEPDTQAAVLEMGMSHRGEISYLTGIAKPDIAVITAIGVSHIEHLGSREEILRAKLEILEGLSPAGKAVLAGDEPLLWELRGKLGFPTFFFGIENPQCDVRATEWEQTAEGIRFRTNQTENERLFLPLHGAHNLQNALAAVCVAKLCGLSPEQIRKGLAAFQNTGSRQRMLTYEGIVLIDDTYNASPDSMRAALAVLAAREGGKRIAVLGGMAELGAHAVAAHREIGALAAQTADHLLVFGAGSAEYAAGAPGSFAEQFLDKHALAERLRALAKPGDTILFKGSRCMRMEQVIHAFCRQGEVTEE